MSSRPSDADAHAEGTSDPPLGAAPDLLRPGLRLVFCGYNPSLTSGASGHHYAHPVNRFWRLLAEAGITPRRYAPHEDADLLDLGIGFTNIVARPTRRADELTKDEIRAGAATLREKFGELQPRIVAYCGVGVYQWYTGRRKIAWGIQPEPALPGIIDVVVPSPSGLNRMTLDEMLTHYRTVADLLHSIPADAPYPLDNTTPGAIDAGRCAGASKDASSRR